MLWSTKRWGRFLHGRTALRASTHVGRPRPSSGSATLLRCASSEASRTTARDRHPSSSSRRRAAQDEFVPRAYRKPGPKPPLVDHRALGAKRRRPSSPPHSSRRPPPPHAKGKASAAPTLRPHRHPRKKAPSSGSPRRRSSPFRDDVLRLDDLHRAEHALSLRMSQFLGRSAGGVSARDVPASSGTPRDRDCHPSELHDHIVADFKTLVVGWSEHAEHMCAAKRIENSVRNVRHRHEASSERPPKATISASDYEDAVLRAERHLESFEAFLRNHGAKRMPPSGGWNEETEATGTADTDVMGRIAAYLGSLFSDARATEATANEEASGAQQAVRSTPRAPDLRLSAFLYEHVLLANQQSHCFGWAAKERSTKRSDRLLDRWMAALTQANAVAAPHEAARVGAGPQRKLFHAVIRQYVDYPIRKDVTTKSGTPELKSMEAAVAGVQRAEEWLARMRYLDCGPDVDTYNLLLLGYCNLCKLFHHRANLSNDVDDAAHREDGTRIRRRVVEGVRKIMSELNERKEGPRPNILSLNLALTSIAKMGNDSIANSILFHTLGERAFLHFLGAEHNEHRTEAMPPTSDRTAISDMEHEEDPAKHANDALRPNLDTYHWVIHIYSASGNPTRLQQSFALLRKMIELRSKEDPSHWVYRNGSQHAAASFSPSIGTHNNVLRAVVGNIHSLSGHGYDVHRAVTAKDTTALLDSMPRYVSSFPTPITFLFLMQIWHKSRSPHAGDHAEKILTRMEVAGTYLNGLQPNSKAYVLALQCWLTSAKAGRSGAAECAFRLFKISRAQADRAVSGPPTNHDESKTRDSSDSSDLTLVQMYSLMMKICATTHVKEDTPRAMAIAFKVFEQMGHDRIKPSLQRFEDLYKCVRHFLDHHPEEEKKRLLQKVFDPASSHGITRGELIGRHEQSLRKASNKSYAVK